MGQKTGTVDLSPKGEDALTQLVGGLFSRG